MVTAAEQVHHIKGIADHPELRLVWSNLLSVCKTCHERVEGDEKFERCADEQEQQAGGW